MDNNCPALRRIAELEAMLKQALDSNRQLAEKVKELEARLKTDSSNSSKPSGSDGLGKKTHQRSLRKKSGRKPGGQKGHHPGSGPEWSDNPDHAEPHALNACPHCGVDLSGVKGRVAMRRQSTDIQPPEVPKITEHQLVKKVCPHCGMECFGEFPPNIKAPTRYGPQLMARAALLNNAYQFIPLARASELMKDFFLCPMSGGTIVNAGKRLFEITEGPEIAIKDQLRKVDVLNADETTMRGPGGNHHIHFAGTERLSGGKGRCCGVAPPHVFYALQSQGDCFGLMLARMDKKGHLIKFLSFRQLYMQFNTTLCLTVDITVGYMYNCLEILLCEAIDRGACRVILSRNHEQQLATEEQDAFQHSNGRLERSWH